MEQRKNTTLPQKTNMKDNGHNHILKDTLNYTQREKAEITRKTEDELDAEAMHTTCVVKCRKKEE